MRLKELLEGVSYVGSVNENAEISDICTRPEDVYQNTLFAAIRGRNTDSHLLIDEAVENGAACIVCEDIRYAKYMEASVCVVPDSRVALAGICANFFKRPADSLTMIGVTGTNGKTTVCSMTEHILSRAGKNVGVIGTLSEEYPETTPEARTLHGVLSRLVCSGCEYAVSEVSSQGLDQHRTAGIRFRVGVFTNLGDDHLDYHGDTESYFEAKALLQKQCDTFLVNLDDAHGRRFMREKNVKTFSVRRNADFRALDVVETDSGTSFRYCSADRDIRITAPIIGLYNVRNMLAALAVCETVCPESVTDNCLADYAGAKGRLERVSCSLPFSVYIDFAHTPSALHSVLRTLKKRCVGRLILVFGCGGERDREKRPKMARIAERYADLLCVTSDNPRKEGTKQIFSDILSGFSSPEAVFVIEDRREAIFFALSNAQKNDIVLLAGKGHEKNQILSDGAHPFDERAVVQEYIKEQEK